MTRRPDPIPDWLVYVTIAVLSFTLTRCTLTH